jgi:hypothetical protein
MRPLKKLYQSERNAEDVDSGKRTLVHFDSLDCFVVNCPRTLLDQFIAFNAEIDDFGPFYTSLDELFRNLMNNICCCLNFNSGISFFLPCLDPRFVTTAYFVFGEISLSCRSNFFLGCWCSRSFSIRHFVVYLKFEEVDEDFVGFKLPR